LLSGAAVATGIIFDVREMTVHDGPGIRTTVFLKGCPLRCAWCHNPEGISFAPELMVRTQGCVSCGSCRRGCTHAECAGLGRCTRICPNGLVRRAGEELEAARLAERLLAVSELLDAGGGGYTLSGGEPLAQPAFALELMALLRPHHVAIETCGFCRAEVFECAIQAADLVMLDLKHMDPVEHARGTGVDNRLVLDNLEALIASGRRFAARIPLIPGYNDGPENLAAVAERLAPARDRVVVELMPVNPLAGSKYSLVGRPYRAFHDPERPPRLDLAPFLARGLSASVS
jgi:pyruvate formate lyase activating enzyme